MSERPTGVFSKDPRVDKVMNYGLSTAVVIALAVGAWFFRELNQTVADLNRSVAELRVEIAVARSERASSYKEFERRIAALESRRP